MHAHYQHEQYNHHQTMQKSASATATPTATTTTTTATPPKRTRRPSLTGARRKLLDEVLQSLGDMTDTTRRGTTLVASSPLAGPHQLREDRKQQPLLTDAADATDATNASNHQPPSISGNTSERPGRKLSLDRSLDMDRLVEAMDNDMKRLLEKRQDMRRHHREHEESTAAPTVTVTVAAPNDDKVSSLQSEIAQLQQQLAASQQRQTALSEELSAEQERHESQIRDLDAQWRQRLEWESEETLSTWNQELDQERAHQEMLFQAKRTQMEKQWLEERSSLQRQFQVERNELEQERQALHHQFEVDRAQWELERDTLKSQVQQLSIDMEATIKKLSELQALLGQEERGVVPTRSANDNEDPPKEGEWQQAFQELEATHESLLLDHERLQEEKRSLVEEGQKQLEQRGQEATESESFLWEQLQEKERMFQELKAEMEQLRMERSAESSYSVIAPASSDSSSLENAMDRSLESADPTEVASLQARVALLESERQVWTATEQSFLEKQIQDVEERDQMVQEMEQARLNLVQRLQALERELIRENVEIQTESVAAGEAQVQTVSILMQAVEVQTTSVPEVVEVETQTDIASKDYVQETSLETETEVPARVEQEIQTEATPVQEERTQEVREKLNQTLRELHNVRDLHEQALAEREESERLMQQELEKTLAEKDAIIEDLQVELQQSKQSSHQGVEKDMILGPPTTMSRSGVMPTTMEGSTRLATVMEESTRFALDELEESLLTLEQWKVKYTELHDDYTKVRSMNETLRVQVQTEETLLEQDRAATQATIDEWEAWAAQVQEQHALHMSVRQQEISDLLQAKEECWKQLERKDQAIQDLLRTQKTLAHEISADCEARLEKMQHWLAQCSEQEEKLLAVGSNE